MKKIFNVGILLALALIMVACGNKNESGSGSSSNNVRNSFEIQSVTGTVDYSSMQSAQYFVAGNNQRFYVQDNSGAMRDAWQRASTNGVFNNNNYIKTVRITGIFNNGQVNNQGNYGYNQQPQYNQQQQQMTVIPSSAEITNR